MLLAERDHHTAPRGQKQARSGRVEREVNYEPRLLEPPLPQEPATVGYVAAPVPLLAQPVLGGGDTLDAAAVQFLLAQSLLQRQREEEEAAQRLVMEAVEAKEKEERKAKFEEKMLVVNRRVRDGTATPAEEAAWRRWMGLVPGSSSSSSGKRRKRKKKRKRKLPKSSSRSSSGYGRPCDPQRRVPAVQEVRVHGASDSVHRRRLDNLVVLQ